LQRKSSINYVGSDTMFFTRLKQGYPRRMMSGSKKLEAKSALC
jgi:hypothetical protein